MSAIVTNFPLFSIVMALAGSVVTSVLGYKSARRLCLSLLSVLVILQSCLLAYMLGQEGAITYQMGHFPAPWGNEIRFGVLEPLFSAVFSFVLLLSVTGGKKDLLEDVEQGKLNIYYTMVDLLQASLLALVYTNDLFTGYVFIEICTISSCGLLMIRQVGRTTLAAVRYMIFSLLGSGLFLMGVILLYGITGHLLMPNIKQSVAALWATGQYHTPLLVVICLMTMGLGVKSGMFPFHFWMPDTYGYSTPSSSSILSGLVSKGYIFLLVKLIYCVIGPEVFYASGAQNLLFLFGVIGMVVGSLSAIRENNIHRMLAYSSAAQIGYIYMGLGLSPVLGVAAALFHILTHAITKPTLFLSAAQLAAVSGNSKRFIDLQGSAHRSILGGIGFTVGALSMVGLPCFAGFVSKYLFASAALQAPPARLYLTLLALAVSTVLNTVYFLRTVIRIYSPVTRPDPRWEKIGKQPAFAVAAVCFVAMNFAVGLSSRALIELVERGLALL